jgi:hypothetical protein
VRLHHIPGVPRCRAWFWFENGDESLSQTIKIIIQGFILPPASAG